VCTEPFTTLLRKAGVEQIRFMGTRDHHSGTVARTDVSQRHHNIQLADAPLKIADAIRSTGSNAILRADAALVPTAVERNTLSRASYRHQRLIDKKP
jgi:hypothetical protein